MSVDTPALTAELVVDGAVPEQRDLLRRTRAWFDRWLGDPGTR